MALEVGSAVLGAVVPSLGKLIKYQWGLDTTVKNGLTSLQDDLLCMHAFLGDVSGIPPDQLESHVKIRAGQVRELSHAIETHLHSFLARIESTKGPIKVWIKNDLASYIKDTQIKVKEMRRRHGVYPSKSSLLESTSTRKGGTRMFATRESNPVGLDGAIVELTKKLSKGDHVAIIGMAGMGKTTLAQAVYDKQKAGFDCGAFVRFGQNTDPEKVLTHIFCALHFDIYDKEPDKYQPPNICKQISDLQLRKFIEDKRCLIVIDDILDKGTWNLVEGVFKDSAGSKIITTTRNPKVAEEVGSIYQMEELSSDHSKELLLTKANAKGDDTEFNIVADKIFRKCGGVPIAITLIGCFLAKNKSKGWHVAYDSIGFDEHNKDGALEHIKKVLSSSYYDLSYDVQRCFLYLSLFPEGHLIEKNMLIWRWLAEGLVPDGLFETGEKCFIELLDRCMIQWGVSPGDVGQGGCRVHSLMFDLIRKLSSSQEQNFSTVLDLDMKKESTPPTRPIRLAIHEGQNQNTSLDVTEVLSFYANTCPGSSLPRLSKFARLRVVDLVDCDLSEKDNGLKHLGKLGELEFIGLLGTPVAELPKKMGRLKFLQTLDVTATGINELPPFIEGLRKLRCLRAGKGTRMMGKLGELTSLEELWLHSADKSPDFASELRKLTKLRVLAIRFDEMDEDLQEALVESLRDLKNLQILQVWSDAEGKIRLSCWEGSVPSPKLRQLLLFGIILPRPMPWIHCSCVPELSKLLLQVETLTAQHLDILGQMPSLRSLYLHSEEDKYRLSYTANKNEFQVLEYLNTNIELICGDGGLPMIQELEVGGIRAGRDVGLRGNMPLLKTATYHLDCKNCLPLRVQKAEEELKQAELAHPKRPKVTTRRWNNVVTEMWHVMELIEGTSMKLVRPLPSQENIFDNPEFVKQMLEDFARAICVLELPVGEPPVLRVDDATDATCSPSQGPAQFVNLFNKLLHDEGSRSASSNADANLAESSSAAVSTIKPDGTGSLLSPVLSWLKSPDGAAKMSEVADKLGMDPIAYKRIWKKCLLNPELITIMENLMDENDVSEYMRLHGQLMDQEILDYFSGHDIDEPSSPTGYPGRGHADNLLSWLISLYGAARASALVSKGAAKFEMDPAAFKIMLNKYVLNPELVAAMNSAVQNNDGSEFKRLMAQVMEQENMNYSTEQPKLDTAGKLLSWFNTPEGAALMSEGAAIIGMDPFDFERIYKKCVLKPEYIAALDSAMQNQDCCEINQLVVQLMLPEILNHLAGDDSELNQLLAQLTWPEILNYFAEHDNDVPSSPPGYAGGVRADGSSTSAPPPQSSGQDGENFSRILTQVLPAVEQALAAGPSSGQPIAAQVDAHSELNRGGPADATGKLSSLSSDPTLAAQSDTMDALALASSTASPAQSREDGEDSSTIFNLNERLAIMEKALAADESSGKRSSAQVDADSVLSRGGPAHASDTLSGLSSDPALAAQSDMIGAVATSTPSVAQSGQGGEISTAFNLNELLATLEKAAAAGESSGQPNAAQPDNVGHQEGGGA